MHCFMDLLISFTDSLTVLLKRVKLLTIGRIMLESIWNGPLPGLSLFSCHSDNALGLTVLNCLEAPCLPWIFVTYSVSNALTSMKQRVNVHIIDDWSKD